MCVYIYQHVWVLNKFRKYFKKKELKRLMVKQFTTSLLTLKSFDKSKLTFSAMFALEEWTKSPYSSKMEAKKVEAIVLLDDKFWKSIKSSC